jgi:hypothetical protein
MDSLTPQKLRDVELHPDYEGGIELLKSKVNDLGIIDYLLRHIIDHLWKFADACPRVAGTNLYIYKPDIAPLITGEISVLFTFEIIQNRDAVMLRDISYTPSTEECADEEE